MRIHREKELTGSLHEDDPVASCEPFLGSVAEGAIAEHCNRTEFRSQNSVVRSCMPIGYVICPGVFYVPIARTLETKAIYGVSCWKSILTPES